MMSTRHLNWTVSQLITLGWGTRKLATVPLHSVWKLALVIAVLAIGTSARPAQAEFWFEDFTDGNLSDSGIDWTLTSSSTSSSDGLELNSPNGNNAGAAKAELPVRSQSWSIRTEGRLLRDLGVLGVGVGLGANDTFSGITVIGEVGLGKGAQVLTEWIETDLRPAEEDVIVQFDTFDNVLRMWAWRGQEPPTQDIEPLVEIDTIQPDGFPFLWTNSLIHPTSTAQFSWIAISTEHMPVNMPVPLSDLIGDFSGDDVLDMADIDLLTAQIVAEPSNYLGFDLSGDGTIDDADLMKWRTDAATHNGFGEPYLIGDSNLDGRVDAADLNNLALHWGNDVSGWSAGDFNADGSINAVDLNGLAVNWGRSIPVAASANAPVPEPSGLLLALVGLTLAWRLPRRS